MSALLRAARRARILPLLALLVTFLAGCSDDRSANPLVQDVINKPNDFIFRALRMDQATFDVTHVWQNDGSQATVEQFSNVNVGSAQVYIRDADGDLVYARDLDSDGSFFVPFGEPGAWTIQIVLNDAGGTINLRVQGVVD